LLVEYFAALTFSTEENRRPRQQPQQVTCSGTHLQPLQLKFYLSASMNE